MKKLILIALVVVLIPAAHASRKRNEKRELELQQKILKRNAGEFFINPCFDIKGHPFSNYFGFILSGKTITKYNTTDDIGIDHPGDYSSMQDFFTRDHVCEKAPVAASIHTAKAQAAPERGLSTLQSSGVKAQALE